MPKKKILTNVWINSTNNDVFCGSVYFDDKIIEIIPFDSKTFNWPEIAKDHRRKKIYALRRKKGKGGFADADEVFDGNFNLLIPGAIDAHVHFNTPGFEEREDFEHGSLSAAFGGVTTVIDMPCTSLPPVTSAANFENKLAHIKEKSYIDFALWGGISGNDFNSDLDLKRQISELATTGIVGFKVYLISGMETFTDLTFEQVFQAAEWIWPTGLPMAVHAEKKKLIVNKRNALQAQNKNKWQHYCEARNFIAEGEAVAEMMNVAKMTQCRVHIVHLSTEFGLDIIEKAQSGNIPITAETCPHYLHFTQNSFDNKKISAYLKTAPPVKQLHDKNALWKGLKNNILSFVTTDHAGCNPKQDKNSKNFWEVYGGIPGVEHRVPYLFSEGFLLDRISLEQTINLLSTNAAKFYKLKNKGSLLPGKDADFALINLWVTENISAKNMHSKWKYTPFEDVVLKVKVGDVFLRGEKILEKSKCLRDKPGLGKFVPAEK